MIRAAIAFLAAVACVTASNGPSYATSTPIPAARHWLRPSPPFAGPDQYLRASPGPFPLPGPGGPGDPTIYGGSVTFADSTMGGASVTFSLPASGWKGLGNPAGVSGYHYKGAGTLGDPCKLVRVRSNLIRVRCKNPTVPNITGNSQITLSVGADQYCAEFGGINLDATYGYLRRYDAPAPALCPF